MPDYTTTAIAEFVDARLEGDGERVIRGVAPVAVAGPEDLTFLERPGLLKDLSDANPGAILVRHGTKLPELDATLLRVDHPEAAFARALALFHPEPATPPEIHSTAIVGRHSRVGEGVAMATLWIAFLASATTQPVGTAIAVYLAWTVGLLGWELALRRRARAAAGPDTPIARVVVVPAVSAPVCAMFTFLALHQSWVFLPGIAGLAAIGVLELKGRARRSILDALAGVEVRGAERTGDEVPGGESPAERHAVDESAKASPGAALQPQRVPSRSSAPASSEALTREGAQYLLQMGAAAEPAAESAARTPRVRLPFRLNPLPLERLPQPSDASVRRAATAAARGPAVRRMWAWGVSGLAGATALMAGVHWAVFGGSEGKDYMTASLQFAVITFVVACVAASYMHRLQPVLLPVLAVPWVIAGWGLAGLYQSTSSAPVSVLGMVTACLPLGLLCWLRWEGSRLRARYPYRPPLNLLELRVFGSGHLGDFLNLTASWRRIGTRQRLDGPGTAGSKASDVVNLLTRTIELSITWTPEELDERLTAFEYAPDGQLRFPLNSIQSGDAVWREAFERLLAQADLVVMDLADLSKENRGVAFELGRLVDTFPLDRLVLLVTDSTDLVVLEELLAQAWARKAEESPNGGSAARPTLVRVGRGTRKDGDRLVAILHDAAQPPRNPPPPEAVAPPSGVRWTQVPAPLRAAGVFYWIGFGIWLLAELRQVLPV